MIESSIRRYWYASLIIGILITGYRLFALEILHPGLFFDEAYYYGWSLTPDWGYYSKPPMVAWIIYLSTHVFGVSEWSVKAPAALLYLLTAWIIQRITLSVSTPQAGFWAFLVFLTMPFVSLNSWFMTTDAPLCFFWALTTASLLRAHKTQRIHDWLMAGCFGGLGLLSKYTMIALPISLLLMYALHDRTQFKNGKLWLALGVALLVFSPNLAWQFLHGFPSFIHTAELANKPGWDGNPLEFIAAQWLVFGPIAASLLLLSWRSSYRSSYRTLWYLCWTPLVLLTAKSIQGEAFINWAAFAYVPGSILTGIILATRHRFWKMALLIISASLALGFYHYPQIQSLLHIEPTKQNTPYGRIQGWRELSLQVKTLQTDYPNAYIGSSSRQLNAYLNFYLDNPLHVIRTVNDDGHIANHYELFYTLKTHERPLLWLSHKPLQQLPMVSQSLKHVTTLKQNIYPNYALTLWVYWIE